MKHLVSGEVSANFSQMNQEVMVWKSESINKLTQHIAHYGSNFVLDIPNQMKFPV